MSPRRVHVRLKAFAIATVLLVSLASCNDGSSSTRARGRATTSRVDRPRVQRPKEKTQPKRNKTRRPRVEVRKKKPRRPTPKPIARGPRAYVSRVVDGDTIEVDLDGATTDVRLIGFDTPETVHPSEPVECFGRAASAYTTDALEGRTVTLEFDIERYDHYDRMLAYVWVDGDLFNEQILNDGYAAVSTYPPNVKYVDRFLVAQREARESDRGLWARCGGVDKAIERSSGGGAANNLAGGSSSGSKGCDAAYSGACIPSYPPDIDCGDVAASDFRSVGRDPHGFDGDSDGVACES